ncbi:MAG: hypothetical protein M9904_18660 [Chitinophagaceae bacterium]|nr:hypothetical protein [Chitinophagaceae bacterium]
MVLPWHNQFVRIIPKSFYRIIFFFIFWGSDNIAFAQKLSVKTKINTIEISNGLLGIVIPSENAFIKGQRCPAPIQSFVYRNGVYSDNSFNELKSPTPVVSMAVKVISSSSSEVTATISYIFQKKEFSYGKRKFSGSEAGPGFYVCTVIVKKGEKSIVIEEDADYDISYTVKISNGLLPDQARYRGWAAASAKQGYEASGKVYRSELERGYPLDAMVDLDYSKSFSYPRLALWEPAGGEYNSGRYWQVFNKKHDEHANLFGFFQGKPSRLLGARGVGVQLQTDPGDEHKEKAASIKINIDRIYADLSWYPRKRFQWAAFISTKADLLPPEQNQPIGREMNRVSGLGMVIDDYAQKPVKIVPSFYNGAVYMSEEQIEGMRLKVKTNDAFYKEICTIDPRLKPVFDAWRFADSAKSLLQALLKIREQLLGQYRSGEGTYAFKYRYWMGTNLFKDYALQVACLFADKTIIISTTDKKKLEGLIAMMARIVWDDNNVPLMDSTGVNLGPANMAFQYRNNGRVFFALLLADDPEFTGRARQMEKIINTNIEEAIYTNGSAFGSPHYIQATIEPVLFSMLQLKNAGIADLFQSNKKIRDFAGFYTTLITPPSVRFQLNRKIISFGDGSEESAPAFALLAKGFANIDPLLSEQLLSLFFYGPPRATLFGPVSLAVDLSARPPNLFEATTANYTGYVSHFRSGVNTSSETALWALNGNSFYDHRNDDAGEVAIYALKAPLSLSRSSFYYPSATDARIRSVVLPESIFPEWNKSEQPIAERSLTNRSWPFSDNIAFASLNYSSSTTIKMNTKDGTQWFRKINMITVQKELPIIVFYDSVVGKGANIWSMPMMSDGPVNTPVGLVTPIKRIYNNGSKKQLPQATVQKRLVPGLGRFVFTGQTWAAHPARGINWELYTYSQHPMDFTIADWGTTWQNTLEVNEFQKTNKRDYSEEQQIIRLQSDQPFFNVLLPYPKGQNPYGNNIKVPSAGVMSIKQNGQDVIISPDFYYVKTKDGLLAALLSETSQITYDGISISGGYTELEYDTDTVKVRVHGNSGKRQIILPFPLQVFSPSPAIELQQIGESSFITISYQSEGLDFLNNKKGNQEFVFSRR